MKTGSVHVGLRAFAENLNLFHLVKSTYPDGNVHDIEVAFAFANHWAY